MMTRDILLIADSHLTEHCPAKAAFFAMLEKISATDYDVLFLGDIFDVWIGCFGYETEIHRRFMGWCRREKEKRKIWFIEGNHEFFIRRNRSEYFTEVFLQYAVLDGGALYALHGDLVNYRDRSFNLLRASLRNPMSYFLIRLFGLTGWGTSFSGRVRKDLQKTNKVQKRYYPRKELLELDESMKKTSCRMIVAGHFHKEASEGMITILENFTGPDSRIGIYHSGTGIRTVSASELFGGLA